MRSGWCPEWDIAWPRSFRLALAHVRAGGKTPAAGEVIARGEDLGRRMDRRTAPPVGHPPARTAPAAGKHTRTETGDRQRAARTPVPERRMGTEHHRRPPATPS
ncbi:hypothetical protein ACE1SV_63870 [Streptomyces sennicomposti]